MAFKKYSRNPYRIKLSIYVLTIIYQITIFWHKYCSTKSVRREIDENYKPQNITLNERKSRMPHIRGIKGEAVVVYCEPLITKKMGYHRLS
jgi:hypothetical protein